MTEYSTTDVLVIGSGIAGLSAALSAAREGADVTLATKATQPKGASSWWAQGGIAVSCDGPDQFKQDIQSASGDTADPAAVQVLVDDANAAVEDILLDTLAVDFDGDRSDPAVKSTQALSDDTPSGFDFGREAAHSESRILHIDASTGKHIHIPYLNYLAGHDAVKIRDDTAALELIRHEGRIHGAILEQDGDFQPCYAGSVVLATGGIGDLYPSSTNPDSSTGDGIAMAALAGAETTDMEYVQFHPTVCTADDAPFLISEAVRGEGALLRNADGVRFMPDYHEAAELAPRDIVARAVQTEREASGEVTLDVSPLDFAGEFPDLVGKCEEHGVDWQDGIPVGPAEHFLCGGVSVDDRGRTSLDRLYAVGECARTGVHGANRLASTSLLEGLVWGLRAGSDAAGRDPVVIEAPELSERDPALPENFAHEKFRRLRRVMDEYVGLERTPEDLQRAISALRRLKGEVDAYTRTRTSRPLYELRSATIVALLVTRQAAQNERSVGCHYMASDGSPTGSTADD